MKSFIFAFLVLTGILSMQSVTVAQGWYPQVSGTTNYLGAVSMVNDAVGCAAGASGTILYTTDGGVSWVIQSNPDSGTITYLTGVSFSDASNGTIVGFRFIDFVSTPRILHTTNGGSNW